jgi:hypothetical protein
MIELRELLYLLEKTISYTSPQILKRIIVELFKELASFDRT